MPIDRILLPDNTTQFLADSVSPRAYIGTCATAAATAAKVVTVGDFPLDSNGKPLVGTLILVKFSKTNTGASPTLNVNDTGAASIWYNTAAYTSSSNIAGYANRYSAFLWDGTYWVWVTHGTDNNTTYSAMTQANLTTGTETTGRLITVKLLRDNFYTKEEVDDIVGDIETLLAAL